MPPIDPKYTMRFDDPALPKLEDVKAYLVEHKLWVPDHGDGAPAWTSEGYRIVPDDVRYVFGYYVTFGREHSPDALLKYEMNKFIRWWQEVTNNEKQ